MSYEYGDRETELLMPDDAKQFRRHCVDCNDIRVVYFVTAPPPPGFALGGYCYRDLLKRCIAGHVVPVPMANELRDALQGDIMRLAGVGKTMYLSPGLPG